MADFWSHLQAEFIRIANEEKKRGAARLCASLSYIDGPTVSAQAQGPFCLLDKPAFRHWEITGNSRDIQRRFLNAAELAGKALGASGYDSAYVWLFALFQFLQRNRPQGNERWLKGGDVGGTIEHVSEASAALCAYFESKSHDPGGAQNGETKEVVMGRSRKPQAKEKLWRPSDPDGNPCLLPYDFGLENAAALTTLEVHKGEWIGVYPLGGYPPYGELLDASHSPRALCRKLKQHRGRISVRLARTKEELSAPLAQSAYQRPHDWHEELRQAGKMSDEIGFLTFGEAWPAVRQLAQTNDAIEQENRINSLRRMFPEAAEKLGLPTRERANQAESPQDIERSRQAATEPQETSPAQNSEKAAQGVESKPSIRVSKAPKPPTPVRGGSVSIATVLGIPRGREAALRAQLYDAQRDLVLWLSVAGSMEERVYVLGMQEQLSALERITERRIEQRASAEDEAKWDTCIGTLLEQFQEAQKARGGAVGKHISTLAERFSRGCTNTPTLDEGQRLRLEKRALGASESRREPGNRPANGRESSGPQLKAEPAGMTTWRRGPDPPVIQDLVNFAMPSGCTDTDIVLRIAEMRELGVEGIPDAMRETRHPREITIFRSATDVLDEIVAKHENLYWSISDGTLRFEIRPAKPKERDHLGGIETSDRKAFVLSQLDKKGWSILDWANESGVDFHTASDYLNGKTNPYRSTRKKLSDSLGVKVDDLPK